MQKLIDEWELLLFLAMLYTLSLFHSIKIRHINTIATIWLGFSFHTGAKKIPYFNLDLNILSCKALKTGALKGNTYFLWQNERFSPSP